MLDTMLIWLHVSKLSPFLDWQLWSPFLRSICLWSIHFPLFSFLSLSFPAWLLTNIEDKIRVNIWAYCTDNGFICATLCERTSQHVTVTTTIAEHTELIPITKYLLYIYPFTLSDSAIVSRFLYSTPISKKTNINKHTLYRISSVHRPTGIVRWFVSSTYVQQLRRGGFFFSFFQGSGLGSRLPAGASPYSRSTHPRTRSGASHRNVILRFDI